MFIFPHTSHRLYMIAKGLMMITIMITMAAIGTEGKAAKIILRENFCNFFFLILRREPSAASQNKATV